jgi:hypothetical protein
VPGIPSRETAGSSGEISSAFIIHFFSGATTAEALGAASAVAVTVAEAVGAAEGAADAETTADAEPSAGTSALDWQPATKHATTETNANFFILYSINVTKCNLLDYLT